MNLREEIDELINLKNKGKNINDAIDDCANKGIYHRVIPYLLHSSYGLSIEDCEKLVYANKNFKNVIIENNPFLDDLGSVSD